MLPRRGRSATVRQWWHMTSSEDEQIVDLPSSGEEEEPKRAKLAATKAGSHEGAQASGSLLGVAPPAQSVSAAAAAATCKIKALVNAAVFVPFGPRAFSALSFVPLAGIAQQCKCQVD